MMRRAWVVVAAVAWSGLAPGQTPPPAPPAAGPSEIKEGQELTLRTAGQPERRVRVSRVSVYPDGQSLADVEDVATGAKYTLPTAALAGLRRVEPQPRTTAPQPVRTAPPATDSGWPRSGAPAALSARPGFRTNIPVPAPPAGSYTPFTPVGRTAVPPPSAIKRLTQPSPSYTPTPSPTVTPPSYTRPAPVSPPVPAVTSPRVVEAAAPSAPVMPTVVVPLPARTQYSALGTPKPAPGPQYSVLGTQSSRPPAPASLPYPDPVPAGRTRPVAAEVRVPDRMDEELRPYLTDLTAALRPSVRERAASALVAGRYGWRPEVKAELAKAAESDPAPSVRAHCIQLLSDLGYHEPRYVSFLDAAAATGPPEVQKAARAALAKLTSRR